MKVLPGHKEKNGRVALGNDSESMPSLVENKTENSAQGRGRWSHVRERE